MPLQRTIVLVCLALIGCQDHSYRGDGKLSDDVISPSERFRLDLGPIDLESPNTRVYHMASLPAERFAIGVEVTTSSKEYLYEAKPIDALIHLVLTDEQGRVVIDEEGPLKKWVWSGGVHGPKAFVFRGGLTRDTPLGGGMVRPDPIGVKTDQGWGTFFLPRKTGEYALKLSVLKGDPAAGRYQTRLGAKTGGWE